MTVDINIVLQVCLVILIMVLILASIVFIIVLFDIKFITNRIKREVKAVTFMVDVFDFLVSGFHMLKKKMTGAKLSKNIKDIIMKGKGDCKENSEENSQ
ncbi:MAG: hypothetical protein FD145_827 [Candidatus Saganbacteria bacterium]|uniref:Uncharacterized protein n=1 Tax=Candidatus Saganbacteria bacterium TaxID=2575572 RepID=A0A833L116_UNCSA|nr:MAG: hypothetical protein FD145_827 [Candidatus Saganbacteria bacterium]